MLPIRDRGLRRIALQLAHATWLFDTLRTSPITSRAAGANDIEVQLILGHADIETSRRLYGHLLAGSGESAVARVEQLRRARRAR